MITNNIITYYHKSYDADRLTEWQRFIFEDVWVFGGKGSNINSGYENANDVNVRIPINLVDNFELFKIGDIIAVGKQKPIKTQSDLEGIEFYNVTSVNVNNFGNSPHIHLGGK